MQWQGFAIGGSALPLKAQFVQKDQNEPFQRPRFL
jgi:hypothetical protein